jgi:hypothetical protein
MGLIALSLANDSIAHDFKLEGTIFRISELHELSYQICIEMQKRRGEGEDKRARYDTGPKKFYKKMRWTTY